MFYVLLCYVLRAKHALRFNRSSRILTACPSTTPLRPRLRSRLTRRGRTLRRKPWTFGVQDSHLYIRYSNRHSHFCILQQALRLTFKAYRTLPYHSTCVESLASVFDLILDESSALPSNPHRLASREACQPVSYYAFFKGWLLLSQPPGCLGNLTSFAT